MADQGPTGSIEPSESTEDTGPTGTISLSDLMGGTAPPPLITLTELLTDVSILQQQESEDRTKLRALSNPDLSMFRSKLIPWLAGGSQGFCDLIRLSVSPPNVCSDGVSRNLFDYIHFLSGKSLVDHMQPIHAILPDFEVGYQCSRTELRICVVRIKA